MHDHHGGDERERGAPGADATRTVALVGAPNVGKSALFNALADREVDVSNYPGTTVEATAGTFDGGHLVDAPGTYGISSFSEEERVARQVVLDADAVINVVDATQLDRDLFLTYQLLDMGVPTVVALNVIDEARRNGDEIDVDALSAELGVPVVPTVAVDGEGVDDLREAVAEATAPEETPVQQWFDRLPDVDATRAERVLLAEEDRPTLDRVTDADVRVDGGTSTVELPSLRDEVYEHRRRRVDATVEAVRSSTGDGRALADAVDDLLLDPRTGTPLALVGVGLIYLLVGDLVAQRLVDFLELAVFEAYYVPWVVDVVDALLPAGGAAEPLRFVLVNDNLGLLTVTVQYLLGVLLPLVVAFYLVIGALEDSGLLPRIAVLTDRGLSRIGLNGRAVIPMIVGLGCVTMAVISTRIAGSRRERLISTALLGLAIPCSAQLGIILGLLGALGLGWWFAYVGVILLVFGVAGAFLDRTLPGESQGLVTELPRLRRPRAGDVLRKTATRTKGFLAEAIPLFAVTAVLISVAEYAGYLAAVVRSLRPLTDLIGLPAEFGQVLVLGLVRRDFAAAGMTDLALAPAETFVGLVVITLFVPCVLSMAMIVKERSLASGVLMWVGSWIVAFLVGAILATVVSFL
ncbi:ferrous iron transport protein B [Salinilacihabitans rarus]|uniref:ferrous iron transport protein B n=1 Tax=Salinilacihabitans rarus TaxID=2961596 RepID=UPI0020C861E2|nr:ferrous iron transport protein B [Salinilacihabitans rarus]